MATTCFSRRASLLFAAVLSLLTLAAFLPVVWCDFINFDDEAYVSANPDVVRELSCGGIGQALNSTVLGLWHPLSIVSFNVDYQFFGLNPAGYHLENLLIHVANGVLLLLLLRNITGSLERSAAVAALFALHPLRVESVAWIAERKDLLSVLFFLLALLAYVRYTKRRSWRAYALIPPLQLLSLMAKPMFVTLPFVLLLLDYWPLNRFGAATQKTKPQYHQKVSQIGCLFLEKLPLLLVSVAVSWYVMHRTADAAGLPAGPGAFVQSAFLARPFPLRLANAMMSYVRYLGSVVWPTDLAVFYPMPDAWPLWQVAGAALLLAAITILALILARRQPHVMVGWFWYLGLLVPVLGAAVQICDYSMADRYTYISTVGVVIMLVWSIPQRLLDQQPSRKMLAAGFAVVLLILGVFTNLQATCWTDDITLFQHTADVTRNNAFAHLKLGESLATRGRTDEAIAQFELVEQLWPNYCGVYHNLGVSQAIAGRPAEAIAAFQRAVQLEPRDDHSMACWGEILADQGRYAEAIALYERAVAANPKSSRGYADLGDVLANRGQREDAVHYYERSLELAPRDWTTHINMASTLLALRRTDEMLRHCQQAIRLNPRSAEAHYTMARGLLTSDRVADAIKHLEAASALDPHNTVISDTLAEVAAGWHATQGR